MNLETTTSELIHQEQRIFSPRFLRRLAAAATLSGALLLSCEAAPEELRSESAMTSEPSPSASRWANLTETPTLEETLPTPLTIEQNTALPQANEKIPPAQVTDLLIVNEAGDTVLAVDVRPLENCLPVIDPPRRGKAAGATYQCMDYAMPGTEQEGLAILAGHSSVNIETDFNSLYTQGNQLVGDTVRVQTAESGEEWLEYSVQSVFTPSKKDLPYMPEVWGAPDEDVDGRLVLVTCLQNPDGSDSTNNFIAVAEKVD